MLGVDLKDQLLQLHLLERKKGTKWYLKLFKRLLSVAIHNSVVIYQCLLNNKNTVSLKFRLSLAQGLVEKNNSGVPCPVHGHPSIELPPKRLAEQHFLEHIPATGKKARPKRKCVMCTKHRKGREFTVYDNHICTYCDVHALGLMSQEGMNALLGNR
jgi:hypothetical protein